jgi:hypothetical protein
MPLASGTTKPGTWRFDERLTIHEPFFFDQDFCCSFERERTNIDLALTSIIWLRSPH